MERKRFTLAEADATAAAAIEAARVAGANAAFAFAAAVIDEDVNLGEFFVLNDVEPEQANAIGALRVGECVTFGGGAQPIFILKRVA